MTERRRILKMLMAGQINISEAEALLDACHEIDDESVIPISKTLKEILKARRKEKPSLNETDGRCLQIDIDEQGRNKSQFHFGARPEELAEAFLKNPRPHDEFIVPDGEDLFTVRDSLDNVQEFTHGTEIKQFLYSLTQIPQSKKLINVNITDDRANTSVLIEVTS